MALALDRTRMMPSLPYKLDRIVDFGYGNPGGNKRERVACLVIIYIIQYAQQ